MPGSFLYHAADAGQETEIFGAVLRGICLFNHIWFDYLIPKLHNTAVALFFFYDIKVFVCFF